MVGLEESRCLKGAECSAGFDTFIFFIHLLFMLGEDVGFQSSFEGSSFHHLGTNNFAARPHTLKIGWSSWAKRTDIDRWLIAGRISFHHLVPSVLMQVFLVSWGMVGQELDGGWKTCWHFANAQDGVFKTASNVNWFRSSHLMQTHPYVTWSSFPSLAETQVITHLRNISD